MMDRERIRKAIDSIEPEEGARERMLAGIKAKAKAEEQRRRMMRSRSLQWLAAAACFCLVVLGSVPGSRGGAGRQRNSAGRYYGTGATRR